MSSPEINLKDESIRDESIRDSIVKWIGSKSEKKEKIKEVEKKIPDKEWEFYYKGNGFNCWNKVTRGSDGLYDFLLKGLKNFIDKSTIIYIVEKNNSTYFGGEFNYEKKTMKFDSSHYHYDIMWELEVPSPEYENVDLVERYENWFDLSSIDSLQQSLSTKVIGIYDYTEIPLLEKDDEFKLMAGFFQNHSNNRYKYKINSIRKIIHPVKARKYLFEREISEDQTEALLFHGSKAPDKNVLSDGLDMRYSNSGNSGRAIYVSNSVDYSHSYSSTNIMYIVQCLIGKVLEQGTNTQKISSPPEGYNSVWHYQTNPDVRSENVDIFAMYSNDHTFITHAIGYTRS